MPVSFRLYSDSPKTISEQISQQIELAIAKGTVLPGESIQSVRKLAVDLKVNPNTVVKAFQMLVQNGSLISQKGRGYFVADNISRFSNAEKEKQLTQAAEAFVATTRPLGLTKSNLLQAISELLPEGEVSE